MDDKQIRKDILRYSKNKTSSGLALLAILLNVFYFVSIYRSDVGNYYYTWLTGVSIIFNLVFMLTVFLCSEGVKNYHTGYSVTLIIVGVIQFVRTQIIPKKAFAAVTVLGEQEIPVMTAGQYTRIIFFLIASGSLLILAGIFGIMKTVTLRNYLKEIETAPKQQT
ncbi:MAG: hypothetical protein J6S72_04340 [Lachnospiraceae bacterium]|nr:hypothetical protein [Lachnospiraceae bacterium]MBO7633598.1 hypothetical protein [Lachnospiraceae bacterium]MBP5652148.1 hypothetical protein [Lachnospiraceae bacterium]